MQRKHSPENFFADMQSTWSNAMETSRKNLQAMTEANQRTLQGWQKMAQRQTEMVNQFIQDNGIPSFNANGSTEEKMTMGADAVQAVFQRSLENTRELAQLATQCTKDAADVVTKRAAAAMKEMKIPMPANKTE